MACEKCWTDANHEALLTGQLVPDVYRRLLAERADDPCTPEQQRGERPDAAH